MSDPTYLIVGPPFYMYAAEGPSICVIVILCGYELLLNRNGSHN